jgi:hypothetical protein
MNDGVTVAMENDRWNGSPAATLYRPAPSMRRSRTAFHGSERRQQIGSDTGRHTGMYADGSVDGGVRLSEYDRHGTPCRHSSDIGRPFRLL